VKKVLKKLTHYYNEDGDPVNITDEKIYWDTKNNQFRHKFECCECKNPMGCRCYETLLQALNGVEEGIICEECGISEALNNVSPFDLMDVLDDPRLKQVNEFIQTLVTKEMILEYMEGEELGFDELGSCDIQEIIGWDDSYEKLRDFIISIMTQEEKRDEFYEGCDGLVEGESCDI
jgi:hypothetical protein